MPSLKQGQTLTKDDLNVYFYVNGSLSDPLYATYTLYDFSSGTDEVIGLPDRTPIKFGVGSYFAQWTVPDNEPVGVHKIRWKYKESATSLVKEDVEEFQIIPLCAGVEFTYPANVMYLIQHLRNKLRDINPDRDYSIAGEELLNVIADGKEITVSIEELYQITRSDKNHRLTKALKKGKLLILSANATGSISLRKITEVQEHCCPHKKIFLLATDKRSIIVTEDHSLYTMVNGELKEVKPLDAKQIVIRNYDTCLLEEVTGVKQIENREYMYDLSVEENNNFFLKSDILAHNSFSAPSKEGEIAGFTKTRGYRWSDDSLYMHLTQACNYLNLIPPDTNYDLNSVPAAWQPLLLMQAMSYALFDLAILWINEEFSYSLNGISLDIQRSDKYMNAATTLQTQTTESLTASKMRLHYIIGLRQSKYVMSYGFLGPHASGKMNVKRWVLGFGTKSDRGF